MIKFKTKKTVPQFGKYNKHLGDFLIRMIIRSVTYNGSYFMPEGEYYYINNEGQPVSLEPIKISPFELTNENVTALEANLPALETNSLADIMKLRSEQFSFIKWQMENGSSWGLLANDWEIDME